MPIVEPEVLLDGEHDIDRTLEVAEATWAETFKYLADNKVLFEGILLKPSMVTPGAENPNRSTPEQVADYTLKLLTRRVPPAVPGALRMYWGLLMCSAGFRIVWLRWPPVACLSVPSRSQHVCVSSCAASGLALLLVPMPVLTRCPKRHPRVIVRMRLSVDLTSTSSRLQLLPLVSGGPPSCAGIMFLSGGQSELEATLNLNAINQSPNPWHVSFSYARALQNSVLKSWQVRPVTGACVRVCQVTTCNLISQTVGRGESCIVELHSAQLLMPVTRRARRERALLLRCRAGRGEEPPGSTAGAAEARKGQLDGAAGQVRPVPGVG